MQKPILTTYLLFILTACQPNNSIEQKEEEGKSKVSQTSENVVTVKLAASKIKSFPLQVMATGKVTALTQAKINFKTSGVIEKIMVSNSATVKSGQVLAVLDNEQQRIALQQAQDVLQDTRVELNKLLLEFGGKDRDTSSVSNRILENIKANKVIVGFRPEAIVINPTGALTGNVLSVDLHGSYTMLIITLGNVLGNVDNAIHARVSRDGDHRVGETLSFDLKPSMVRFFDVETERAINY